VNLVYEKDFAFFEVGKYGGKVAGSLDCGAGRDTNRHLHLIGDDVADSRLTEAGWAVKE
jgi:hypothetical protein